MNKSQYSLNALNQSCIVINIKYLNCKIKKISPKSRSIAPAIEGFDSKKLFKLNYILDVMKNMKKKKKKQFEKQAKLNKYCYNLLKIVKFISKIYYIIIKLYLFFNIIFIYQI